MLYGWVRLPILGTQHPLYHPQPMGASSCGCWWEQMWLMAACSHLFSQFWTCHLSCQWVWMLMRPPRPLDMSVPSTSVPSHLCITPSARDASASLVFRKGCCTHFNIHGSCKHMNKCATLIRRCSMCDAAGHPAISCRSHSGSPGPLTASHTSGVAKLP